MPVALTRRDIDEKTHEIHVAGTKAVGRDRMVLVAKWAWPAVAAHIKPLVGGALLWPGVSRWDALDAHREAAAAASVRVIPLRNSRHHWAVRAVRAGTPLAVVAGQLGHGSVQLAANTYGRFVPTAVERSRWERRAAADDAAREQQQKRPRGAASPETRTDRTA